MAMLVDSASLSDSAFYILLLLESDSGRSNARLEASSLSS
jgi:hypothetical protein